MNKNEVLKQLTKKFLQDFMEISGVEFAESKHVYTKSLPKFLHDAYYDTFVDGSYDPVCLLGASSFEDEYAKIRFNEKLVGLSNIILEVVSRRENTEYVNSFHTSFDFIKESGFDVQQNDNTTSYRSAIRFVEHRFDRFNVVDKNGFKGEVIIKNMPNNDSFKPVSIDFRCGGDSIMRIVIGSIDDSCHFFSYSDIKEINAFYFTIKFLNQR